jgi:hypothetical protein
MKIGRYEITLKPLSWYEKEIIKAKMVTGARMKGTELNGMDGELNLQSTLKTIELSIEQIKEGDTVIPYSEKWIQGLTSNEGDILTLEIDNLSKKK